MPAVRGQVPDGARARRHGPKGRPRIPWAAAGLLGLVAFLYAYALELPFFWDDSPILTWIMTHGWRAILFSTENGYYRPLPFAIYKTGWLVPPPSLRAAALHLVAPLLLWLSALLLRRIAGGRQGTLAAIFLVTYPLLNEAVVWVTALPHPLVIFLTLLALDTFLRREQGGKSGRLGLLALGLAPLAHESGAVSVFIVAGFVLIRNRGSTATRRWLLLAFLFDLLIVLGRGLINGAQTATALHGLSQLEENGFYFLQVLLYPLGPLLGHGVQQWGWHDFTALGIAALLVGLWAVAVRRGKERALLAALWWWGVAATPFILALDYRALFVGARLSAFAAVGAALFWAALIEATATALPRQAATTLRVGLTALVLLPAIAYHVHVARLYRLLDRLYDEVIAIEQAAPNRPATFVNLPAALTWTQRTFPLVTDNAVFVPPDYTDLRLFLLVNVGLRDVDTLTCPDLCRETEPFWLTQGAQIDRMAMRERLFGRETFLGYYEERDGHFHVRPVGSVAAGHCGSEGPRGTVHFADGTRLVDYRLQPLAEGTYRLRLCWETDGPSKATVFVHVMTPDGATMLAQADGDPLGGLLPLQSLRRGDRIIDLRTVRLPDTYHGDFIVRIGLYTGDRRLRATLGDERTPDDAPILLEGTVN